MEIIFDGRKKTLNATNQASTNSNMKRKLNEAEDTNADTAVHVQRDFSTFSAFGLDLRLLQALAQEGFSTPTNVQAQAIPLALEGKNILARAKTGSGKTIAYLLPVLQSILGRKTDGPAKRGISAVILVPTRELAQQVSQVVTGLSAYCAKFIRSINLTQQVSDTVQRSQLAESPDIIIATPARIAQNLSRPELDLGALTHFIVDEADLVLSYGYEEDLQLLAKSIPKGVQMMLLSATLSTDIEILKGLFCRDPVVLELDEIDEKTGGLSQCAEDEKFLLTYVIFKLKLIKGKCIIFVSDIDRCYRLKLFFEQFGIKSCVLNSELPVNSRIHVVQEFNKNVYEIIIATDEHEVLGKRAKKIKSKKDSVDGVQDSALAEVDNTAIPTLSKGSGAIGEDDVREKGADDHDPETRANGDEPTEHERKRRKGAKKAKEYGISRGIDFKNVACVLNFDLPTSSKSYTHRTGRTARAGNSGTALSFVIPTELYHKHKATTIPSAEHDEAVLAQIIKQQQKTGQEVKPYDFDMKQVDAFRYRMTDALRAVTRIAIREARTRELRQELLNSEKLKRHFEENPAELHHLRHDGEFHTVRVQPHLKHVPEYLMPPGGATEPGTTRARAEMGFVPMRKTTDNRIRKARMHNRMRGKGKGGKKMEMGAGQRKAINPLKSFSVKRR